MPESIDPFYIRYRGAFSSLLKWTDLDHFWTLLIQKSNAGWYVYEINETPPEKPMSPAQLENEITRIKQILRAEHKQDYCGIVYTDSKTEPTYIKIYDPKNLGVVCGISREPVPPRWIISLLPPQPLEQLPPLAPPPRPWWKRIPGLAAFPRQKNQPKTPPGI